MVFAWLLLLLLHHDFSVPLSLTGFPANKQTETLKITGTVVLPAKLK